MSVIRIEKNKNYTVMSNYHLREKNLSLKAKGLMSLMLSLPNDWDYSIAGLTAICCEGKDSIATALAELEKYGYLVREQTRTDDGHFGGANYILYEQPHTDKPLAENPLTVNPPQLNTNNINELNNKKENQKERDILDFWNSKDIIKHKDINTTTSKAIQKAIKEYSVETIKECIDRYSQVIKDSNYYFDTRWTLCEFLKQRNALPDFLDDGSKWVNYKNRRKDTTILRQHDYNKQDFDSVFENFNNF